MSQLGSRSVDALQNSRRTLKLAKLTRTFHALRRRPFRPHGIREVPVLFGCGLVDAANLPASSEGQKLWFPKGYERIEFPDVGHFPNAKSPTM